MNINVDITDRNGSPINMGDSVELFDWGGAHNSLGIVTVVWDSSEGRISSTPNIVDDAYDFFTKALPRSIKIGI
jgi:hypothetical protein